MTRKRLKKSSTFIHSDPDGCHTRNRTETRADSGEFRADSGRILAEFSVDLTILSKDLILDLPKSSACGGPAAPTLAPHTIKRRATAGTGTAHSNIHTAPGGGPGAAGVRHSPGSEQPGSSVRSRRCTAIIGLPPATFGYPSYERFIVGTNPWIC